MKLTSCVALARRGRNAGVVCGPRRDAGGVDQLGARCTADWRLHSAGIRIGLDALERLKVELRRDGHLLPGEGALSLHRRRRDARDQASPGQGLCRSPPKKRLLTARGGHRPRSQGGGGRALQHPGRMDGQDRRLEQGARSGRRYAAVMAAPGLFDVAAARDGLWRKATHLGRMRRTLTQGLATGGGLIVFRCPSWAFPP